MDLSEIRAVAQATEYVPRAYSGRGMGGRDCLGFDVPAGGAIRCVVDLVAAGLSVSIAREAKVDSLGTGEIVYFPRVPASVLPVLLGARQAFLDMGR